MIIRPKVRGFVCVTAHPTGCAANVQEQIDYVKNQSPVENGPKNVLIVGASTGYGLASRIAAAFGCGANTLGIYFERPSERGRTATPGWYNSVALEKAAKADGLYASSINGDAFSNEIKEQSIERIKLDMGKIDLVIYSLASPRRTDPKTGETYRSALKPIGAAYSNKYLDTDKRSIQEATVDAATDEDIQNTVKVMGGDDWELWIQALKDADLLSEGFKTVAYDYIGPKVTWPIYKDGTIGQAKVDLRRAKAAINESVSELGGEAHVSVNKAVVTQASSAIPGVNLYITILFKIMKELGGHEGCIEQIQRLFSDRLYNQGGNVPLDELGLIRMDDWEMEDKIQDAVTKVWPLVSTENLEELTDFEGYQTDFLRLFGFGIKGVDYDAEVEPEVDFD
ncbi:enoyl-ACP reductase FabV [Candidatus Pelagisphaera phototrophica]|uniref:enoyl-ACP reductase FabV n=1 Tax=Candidatus Pelagisphaera phototrophica TaxID=2684113 RepID=UPI0019F014BB|nr:enoyl-ACP reductase FabV [Candidatus Pelagisphaera phototrophica]QXD32035.1 trans-2-enoyl-CoA reductase family protein [Candidatus Pelagisphaera phototrophica]